MGGQVSEVIEGDFLWTIIDSLMKLQIRLYGHVEILGLSRRGEKFTARSRKRHRP